MNNSEKVLKAAASVERFAPRYVSDFLQLMSDSDAIRTCAMLQASGQLKAEIIANEPWYSLASEPHEPTKLLDV